MVRPAEPFEASLSLSERAEVQALSRRSLDLRGDPGEGARPAEPGLAIRGYDLERPFDISEFVASLASTGFQASALGQAIAIVRRMRDARVPIFLGVTSNVGTCGLRDHLTYLVKHRHLRGLAATAGAIEEDVMKVLKPFALGDFGADDAKLRSQSICRTGNIFIPGERYTWLHMVLWTLHRRLARESREGDAPLGVVEYVRELGRQLEVLDIEGREASFVYQAYRNGMAIYSPALLDGALGDAVYHWRQKHPDFSLDVARCHGQLIDQMAAESDGENGPGIIAIGGSVPKHMLCNAAIYCGGARYAVYLNTATEADGSNAGASPSEAVSWGKLRAGGAAVKVQAEATLVLPLLLVAAFQTYAPSPEGGGP